MFLEDFKEHGGEATMVENDFTPHTVAPDPLLKDLAGRQMPALKGYVSTELKPRATLSMYVDRAGGHEPVIASWKFGAGKTLAVTTDASGRWSSPWVRANVFAPLWDRLLAWMTPQTPGEQKIDVALGYNAGRINMKLTDYTAELGSGAPGHRAGHAAGRHEDRNRAQRRSARRAFGSGRGDRARNLLHRGAIPRAARARRFRRSHTR